MRSVSSSSVFFVAVSGQHTSEQKKRTEEDDPSHESSGQCCLHCEAAERYHLRRSRTKRILCEIKGASYVNLQSVFNARLLVSELAVGKMDLEIFRLMWLGEQSIQQDLSLRSMTLDTSDNTLFPTSLARPHILNHSCRCDLEPLCAEGLATCGTHENDFLLMTHCM